MTSSISWTVQKDSFARSDSRELLKVLNVQRCSNARCGERLEAFTGDMILQFLQATILLEYDEFVCTPPAAGDQLSAVLLSLSR